MIDTNDPLTDADEQGDGTTYGGYALAVAFIFAALALLAD
jgi:hypothetical protein